MSRIALTLSGPPSALSASPERIRAGTPEFRRSNRALFLGGFSTFSLLYCVQPLMPIFAREFGLSAVQSSWSLSISTAALAIFLLVAGIASDSIGRKPMMCGALLMASVATILCAFAQNYLQLLVMRGILGVVLAGLPAVAMAYLSEEIEPTSLGYSMGLYISGSALGGMLGRVCSSQLTDVFSWRVAIAIIGVAGLLSGIEFWRSLPRSHHFHKSRFDAATIAAGLRGHFRDQGLRWLFLLGFLLLGSFVSLYNYMSFRLLDAHFGLRQSAISAIFSLYVIGMFSSVWVGKLGDKFGRRRVLWLVMSVMLAGLLLTLANTLALIVVGIACFTFGFFGSHSIASSWVGRRAKAPQALASALYLLSYYLGSALVSSAAGIMWGHAGWNGVVLVLTACLLASLFVSLRLRTLAIATPDLPAAQALSLQSDNPGA
ncbi:MAG: MFS transporter [Burkholderiaceae bacterium]|nr:MFS transporter [Burkholderiaceae bacterium]